MRTIRHQHRFFSLALTIVFMLGLVLSHDIWGGTSTSAKTNDEKGETAESRFTTLDGARIHYVNYGKGSEALVLIHGWTCNIDNWRDNMPEFAKRNRVIAIDLPGHGQSDKPEFGKAGNKEKFVYSM